ncbi:MAG: hypothetical protein WAL95_10380 [Candidatus Acidiferrales bacterium]
MTKTKIPEYLPISPVTLVCPLCNAQPNVACETAAGGELELVHVARIKVAAKLDVAAKKAKKKVRNGRR